MCIAPTANVKKRRTCPERLVWRCWCTSWEVQLAARSGPFSFASQPSGWFADSSVLWGVLLHILLYPPISKSRGFVKFGICYKYSLFLVQFDWSPLRHCCAMPPLPKGEAIASQRVDDAKYNLSVACVLRLVLMPLPSVAKRHLFAKASPTRGGGIERSDDDGEVGQINRYP